MKYFFDTEFAETGGLPSPTIDLISIGIVAEDGREYYAESSEFQVGNCNQWVAENVLPLLGPVEDRKKRDTIRDEIAMFVGGDLLAEFWAYYADYDWVTFCWLWGGMVDLPKGFPMICMDLQQEWIRQGRPDIKPPDPADEHNALADAKWNAQLYEALKGHNQPYLKEKNQRLTKKEMEEYVLGPSQETIDGLKAAVERSKNS